MRDRLLSQQPLSKTRGSIVLSLLVIGVSLIRASYFIANGGGGDVTSQSGSVGMGVVSSSDSFYSSEPSETNFHTDVLTDPDPNAPWPRIAWLMSFPNSGTSYTIRLTQTHSKRTAASNYGLECLLDENDKTVPVHANSPDGPFLLQPSMRELPDRYIITKTHCAGYGTALPPDTRIITHQTFLLGCLESKRIDGNNTVKAHYDKQIVQRAIHLVRDPFNNIVSRFHLQQHRYTKEGDNDWLKKYPNTPEGFQNWCAYMNNKTRKEESESSFIDDDLLNAQKGVPCFAEFFKYAQWHQLALDTTRDLKIPTLIIHYEDFGTDHSRTVEKLFDFLELEPAGKAWEFITGKNYDEYFSKMQRVNATKLIKKLVNPDTWELLERYDVY